MNDCACAMLGTGLRQCEHKRIFRDGQRLTSVTKVVSTFFPLPSIAPEILENARERGLQTDTLFADYVRGTLRVIPAGTRRDAVDLLHKLIAWYDKQSFKKVEVQVLLGDGKFGGIVDFRFDGIPTDLKSTYNVDHSHRLQVAGYACLDGIGDGDIIHVTARLSEVRVLPIQQPDYDDWRQLRDAYEVLDRRGVLAGK